MALFTGKTVEDAIVLGLQNLGLARADVKIRVVAKEKKGFLGFGRRLAEVEMLSLEKERQEQISVEKSIEHVPVEPILEEEVPVSEQKANAQVEVLESALEIETAESTKVADEAVGEDNVTGEEVAATVVAYVEKIIYEMDVEASLLTKVSRRHVTIQIETPEPGRIIGYHGKVLKSLQLLAQNFLHDRYPRYFSVSLNVHDYLEHRMETLIDFTKKVSARVLETGKEYIMDPMSNSERKIVHKTVSQIEGVESYSEGNDPNRYVVIVARGNS